MTSLALTSWEIRPLPTGEVQIGASVMPAHVAADIAARIYEAANAVPEAVAGRVRCREHLDRLFADATPVHVRDMQTHATGRFMAIRDGRRLVVRLGDTQTATLLDEGERWRGFGQQLRDDPLFGIVTELATPMRRYSASGLVAKAIVVRP